MNYQQITVERRDEVALVTLNRPERVNAWTPRMSVELADAIVVTGAGRGFCAGADMSDTYQSRIDGRDPGEDTAGGEGDCRAASTGWRWSARRSR